MSTSAPADTIAKVFGNVEKVIRGKSDAVRRAIVCWLAGGHLLFEDVPGTGKTMLARALATSVSAPTKRVQFTPDLMPADITGMSIYHRAKNEFQFIPGPLFAAVLLADEINRATPRTQSALLEAMAEGHCTVENKTYRLPENFFVIATQNPVEQQGTFPLPEAQLDRFMMRLSLGYPDQNAEKEIVLGQMQTHPIEELNPVVSNEEWSMARKAVREVAVKEPTVQYAMSLTQQTRRRPELALGCSPRATVALVRCAQALALAQGDNYVKPDYVKTLAPAILQHRLILSAKSRLNRVEVGDILRDIVHSVPVPVR